MSRHDSALSIALATLGASITANVAHAGLNYNIAPAPGGFVQACAGPSTGSGGWPGADHFSFYTPDSGANLVEEAFTGDTTADASAMYAGGNTTNGANGLAGFGFIQLGATNDAPNNSFFAAGMANGGWSETFVISNRALTGQDGFMQFTLDVQGTLFASGFAGSAAFTVAGYKDTILLFANPLFDPGDSDPISTDRQYGNWAVATFGNPPTASKTVDDTVTFAVPFTFGTPFKLGIYADARAGMRSSSGVFGNSTAQSQFEEGLVWGGIAQIYHGFTPISEYTITSGSAVDWTQPIDGGDPADLDGNGVVNSADLAILLGGWGTSAGDINGDGTTNATDLALLLAAWS
ncbi:MAG: dockerin type I repeat-containing protein [Phycisphaerae bacterium]|nr:dockerin type I repeat-containing protein [Phycisphaerae bacterium]